METLPTPLPSAAGAVPALPPEADLAAARRYLDASRSAATRRAYESDWRTFIAWCREHGLDTLPATPGTVATWLAASAEAGQSPATVARRLAAVGYVHRRAGLVPPARARAAPWWGHPGRHPPGQGGRAAAQAGGGRRHPAGCAARHRG